MDEELFNIDIYNYYTIIASPSYLPINTIIT